MKNLKNKRTWIQYGAIAVLALILYSTGLHAEVIGFAQRGILATGIMNPDVEELTANQPTDEPENQPAEATEQPKKKKVVDLSGIPDADYNFKLVDRNGKIRSLEEFKGKTIFMNLWATWCAPCIAEMPSIDKLHEEMGDEVEFVMLSLDKDFQKAKDFDTNKGYDLPIYAPGENLPALYQTRSIPTTYVIDAKGKLALTHKGMADYSSQEFKDFLNSIK